MTAQEQTELAQLKSQVNVINQELDSFYVQIGRRYIDYVFETGDMPGIDAGDLLKLMDPKMTKKKELKQQIIELEKEIKNKFVLREKQRRKHILQKKQSWIKRWQWNLCPRPNMR